MIERFDSAVLKQFADLRKTRYLRIRDELIDYSGINTLVVEQYGSTAPWRNISNRARLSFKLAAAL